MSGALETQWPVMALIAELAQCILLNGNTQHCCDHEYVVPRGGLPFFNVREGNLKCQNLTQPEEIDHILSAMASRGLSMDTLLPDEHPSGITIQNTNHDELTAATDFSCCAENAKPMRA